MKTSSRHIFNLISVVLLACSSLSAEYAGAGGGLSADASSYYPLSVGNTWHYRCGTEGEEHFEKLITVVGRETGGGNSYFKLEQRVKQRRLIFYLWSDGAGNILRSLSSEGKRARVIAAQQMKVGEMYGADRATREQVLTTPATGSITALVVENYNPDDLGLTQEQRNEWQGRFFVRGIGMVSEGDGLGGECILVKYELK